VTVATVELLRSPRNETRVAESVDAVTPSVAAPTSEPLRTPGVRESSAALPMAGSVDRDRLRELERRIEALEAEPRSRRVPLDAPDDALPPAEELRDLVLTWIAEERDERAAARELEGERDQLTAMEFEARYRAFTYKEEHDLTDWEEAKLVEIFVAVEKRRREVEASFDLSEAVPAKVEARWVEFDEWAEQYERDAMGPRLWEMLSDS